MCNIYKEVFTKKTRANSKTSNMYHPFRSWISTEKIMFPYQIEYERHINIDDN